MMDRQKNCQPFQGFSRETSEFLWELTFHNERSWFLEHKEEYLRVLHEPFHALAEDTACRMRQEFPEADFALHISRIYRDARRLFGRGPYKDHLWFTLFDGVFEVTPTEMEVFRSSIDSNPARFERLAEDAAKMRGFRIIGPEYKRQKKDVGPLLNPWYNRKRVGLEHMEDFDPAALGPELPEILCSAYRRLMPLYRYLLTCCRAAELQNTDELRRMNDGS